MAQSQIRSYDHNWGWIGNVSNDSGKANGKKAINHASYLAETPELYEIQRRNNFELSVIFSPSSGNGSADYKAMTAKNSASLRRWDADNGVSGDKSKNYIADAAVKLRLSVSSCTVPNFTQDVIKIRRGNTEVKFAGVPTWGDGTIVCNDYIGAGTYDILASWQALAYNQKTERVGLVEDYKRNAVLTEFTPDYQPVRRWVIHGMWISGLSSDSFDYESNGKMTASVTFQYDWAEIQSQDYTKVTGEANV